jgi:hypothetical protein
VCNQCLRFRCGWLCPQNTGGGEGPRDAGQLQIESTWEERPAFARANDLSSSGPDGDIVMERLQAQLGTIPGVRTEPQPVAWSCGRPNPRTCAFRATTGWICRPPQPCPQPVLESNHRTDPDRRQLPRLIGRLTSMLKKLADMARTRLWAAWCSSSRGGFTGHDAGGYRTKKSNPRTPARTRPRAVHLDSLRVRTSTGSCRCPTSSRAHPRVVQIDRVDQSISM